MPTSHPRREALASLLTGGLLLYLAHTGPLAVLAAWFYTILLLRFTRLSRPWRGFLLVSAVQAVAAFFMLRGVIPVPPAELVVTAAFVGVFGGLVLLADRVLSPRLGGWVGTLVLPSATVAAVFATYAANPFGTWGEPAYSQLAFLPFAQLGALTGLWGMAFVMTWFASVANLVWESGVRAPGARRAVRAFGLVMAGVLVYGAARLVPDRGAGNPVPVAAIPYDRAQPRAFTSCPRDGMDCFARHTGAVNETLFSRSAAAAAAGARIILWSEGAAEVMAPAEAELIARGQRFAREHGVTLVMALAVIPEAPGLWQNKLVAVTDQGAVAWEYLKARPVPGEPITGGDGRVRVLDTPYGRLAAVICFDADFPELVRQAGRQRADLLLVAANDWPEIASTHAAMAVFRGVENGVSLLRATSNGWSLAADSRGRILARSNHLAEDPGFLLAAVPMQGRATPYLRLGDLIAWFSIAFLAAAALAAVVRRRRRGRGSPPAAAPGGASGAAVSVEREGVAAGF